MSLRLTTRHLFVLGLAALAVFLGRSGFSAPTPNATVQSVPKVELSRYVGQWYEIARLPNRYQASCVGDVTATYRERDDGALQVVNRCRTAQDAWEVVEGKATLAPGDASGARLKVTFLPNWLQWVPLGRSDYWVVFLDPGYHHAVISEPQREFLWILSRTPTMDSATYSGLIQHLRAQGYPVDQIVITPQVAERPARNLSRPGGLMI